MSSPPNQPTSSASHIDISGSGNTINFGGNIQQATKSSVLGQWYSGHMATHRFFYWILHLIVALMAAAIWEYRHTILRLWR